LIVNKADASVRDGSKKIYDYFKKMIQKIVSDSFASLVAEIDDKKLI
jgi:hypothetical protein